MKLEIPFNAFYELPTNKSFFFQYSVSRKSLSNQSWALQELSSWKQLWIMCLSSSSQTAQPLLPIHSPSDCCHWQLPASKNCTAITPTSSHLPSVSIHLYCTSIHPSVPKAVKPACLLKRWNITPQGLHQLHTHTWQVSVSWMFSAFNKRKSAVVEGWRWWGWVEEKEREEREAFGMRNDG